MIKENTRSIFAGNLNFKATEKDLEALFEEFGEIQSIRLIQKKGIAFIAMKNEVEANDAIETLTETSFMNRRLFLDWSNPVQIESKPEFYR